MNTFCKSTALCLCLSALFQFTVAQLIFSGYTEHEVDEIKTSSAYFSGYNKLRLDMEQHPADKVGLYATLEAKAHFGKINWLLSDFLPVAAQFDTTFQMQDSLSAEYLYAVLNFDRTIVTLGKQPLALGTGYVWNPTDIFNKKDMLDPTYELTGVPSLRMQYTGRLCELDLIAQPITDGRSASVYFSGKTRLQHFELTALIAQRSLESVSGVETYSGYGGTTVGEFLGLGVWAEFLTNRLDNSDVFKSEWAAGFDYTFESSFYCMFEYYHNDRGSTYSTIDGYSPAGVFDYLSGFNRALASDYQFVMLQYPMGDLHSMSLWGILNLDDNSYIIAPQISLSLFEDVDADISLFLFQGSSNTEFGAQQIGGRFRIRLYF